MDSCESLCAVANSTTSSVNAGSLVLTFDLQAFWRDIWENKCNKEKNILRDLNFAN